MKWALTKCGGSTQQAHLLMSCSTLMSCHSNLPTHTRIWGQILMWVIPHTPLKLLSEDKDINSNIELLIFTGRDPSPQRLYFTPRQSQMLCLPYGQILPILLSQSLGRQPLTIIVKRWQVTASRFRTRQVISLKTQLFVMALRLQLCPVDPVLPRCYCSRRIWVFKSTISLSPRSRPPMSWAIRFLQAWTRMEFEPKSFHRPLHLTFRGEKALERTKWR